MCGMWHLIPPIFVEFLNYYIVQGKQLKMCSISYSVFHAILFCLLVYLFTSYDADNNFYYVYLLSLISKLISIILSLLFFFSHSNYHFAENATNLDLIAEYTSKETKKIERVKKMFYSKINNVSANK